MGGRRALAVLVVVGALAAPASARSAEPLELDPALDTVALGLGATLGISLEVLAQSGELAAGAPGEIGDVNPIDRWIARGSISGTDTPHDISNVLIGIAYGAAVIAPISTGVLDGTDAGWTDLVLYAEAIAWNAAIANVVKLAVRRPRPISYVRLREGTYDPDETDGTLSFYSGHTSTAATVAAAITTTTFLRSPRGCPRPWIMLASGAVLTIATGAMRVAAKRHFLTDVTVGGIVGAGIGVAVPLLHRRGASVVPAVALVPGGGTAGIAGAW